MGQQCAAMQAGDKPSAGDLVAQATEVAEHAGGGELEAILETIEKTLLGWCSAPELPQVHYCPDVFESYTDSKAGRTV